MLCLSGMANRLGRPLLPSDFMKDNPNIDKSHPEEAPMDLEDCGIVDALTPKVLAAIDEGRETAGTFSFAEEFPDYRFLRRLNGTVKVRSCNDVFDEFLAHCEARLARQDLAAATLSSYRRVLNGVWRPVLRKSLFVTIADRKPWSKKTYNNAISILRRAFEFGYRNHPEQQTRRAVFEARV